MPETIFPLQRPRKTLHLHFGLRTSHTQAKFIQSVWSMFLLQSSPLLTMTIFAHVTPASLISICLPAPSELVDLKFGRAVHKTHSWQAKMLRCMSSCGLLEEQHFRKKEVYEYESIDSCRKKTLYNYKYKTLCFSCCLDHQPLWNSTVSTHQFQNIDRRALVSSGSTLPQDSSEGSYHICFKAQRVVAFLIA